MKRLPVDYSGPLQRRVEFKGLHFAYDDQVTLELAADGTYLSHKLSNMAVLSADSSNAASVSDLYDFGVDFLDVQGGGAISLSQSEAEDLIDMGISFVADDDVSLDVDGTFMTTRFGTNGSGEGVGVLAGVGTSGGIGLDHLNVYTGNLLSASLDLSPLGGVTIGESDAIALINAGIQFADSDDQVTLELDADGTYLSHKLSNMAVISAGPSHPASVSELAHLGVDFLDVQGVQGGGAISLSQSEAQDLIDMGISFVADDDVSLDVDGTFMTTRFGTNGSGEGVGVLAGVGTSGGIGLDHLNVYTGNLLPASLDLSPLGGVTIGESDAIALINAGIQFADIDNQVTLELDADGTYLSHKLSNMAVISAGSSHAASVSDLAHLGVDFLDVQGGGAVSLSQSEAQDLIDMGISFVANDDVSLDLTAIDDGDALGTFLGARMHAGDAHGEDLLKAHGIDHAIVVQSALSEALVELDNSDDAATVHVWEASFTELLKDNHSSLKISSNNSASNLDHELLNLVNDLIDSGVSFSDDLDLGTLVQVLGDSIGQEALNIDAMDDLDLQIMSDEIKYLHDKTAIKGYVAGADAQVVMSDELAQALYDAGMFEAVPAAKVQIDAGSNPVLHTSIKLLAAFGVDKVTTTQDNLYLNVGSVDQLSDLASLLKGLLVGTDNEALFTSEGAGQNDLHVVMRVDADAQKDLVDGLLSEDASEVFADLQTLGVDDIEFLKSGVVAQLEVDGNQVQILGGTSYEISDLQDLLNKPAT